MHGILLGERPQFQLSLSQRFSASSIAGCSTLSVIHWIHYPGCKKLKFLYSSGLLSQSFKMAVSASGIFHLNPTSKHEKLEAVQYQPGWQFGRFQLLSPARTYRTALILARHPYPCALGIQFLGTSPSPSLDPELWEGRWRHHLRTSTSFHSLTSIVHSFHRMLNPDSSGIESQEGKHTIPKGSWSLSCILGRRTWLLLFTLNVETL